MRALVAVLLAGACWTGPAPEPPGAGTEPRGPARPSLYERLGGRDAIRAIVDELLANVTSDGRIDMLFMNADAAQLRRHLRDWLCAASGGPCRYTGKRMRAAHAGMRITGDDFEVFVEAFAKAVDRLGVRGRDKVEVVLLVRRARSHIVER